MKELEFNIVNNNILEVADMTWWIDGINSIYISKTNEANWLYPEWGIFIDTDCDTVQLYYKTADEIKITNVYKSLINAIMKVYPNFKMFFPNCFNLKNVKHIKSKKMALVGYEATLTFNEKEYKIVAGKKSIEKLIEEHNQLQENIKL